MKYISDEAYEKSAQRRIAAQKRKIAILKKWGADPDDSSQDRKRKYLKLYFQENKEDYRKRNQTPEQKEYMKGYIKEYMRKWRRKQREKKKAAEQAQKEESGNTPDNKQAD